MDEATALLTTLESTPPFAPTACHGWTAHDLIAHLAAGAAEMAIATEAVAAGQAVPATQGFAEREAPFLALPDAVLRDRLVTEALRLDASVSALPQGCTVPFAGRDVTISELRMHGRSEAALHRWDLAGDDAESGDLLSQPELTTHAIVVLNSMVDGSAEAVEHRAATTAGMVSGRIAFASPGRPDVVLVVAGERAWLELDDPRPGAIAIADPASRLLALWGRRPALGRIEWSGQQTRRQALAGFLWGPGASAAAHDEQ